MSRKSAANGLVWSVVDMGGGQVLSFVTFLILARILAPEEYGTFALAGSFISCGFFLLQGMAPAIIQRGSIVDEHISTAFWTNIAIAIVLAAIMAGSAGFLSAFFHHPPLALVLRWMSLVYLPMALASIPMALFRRDLRMRACAARTMVGYVVGGAVSIPLALNGFGVLSLAFGQIAQWTATVLVVYAATVWRPKFQFSFPAFIELGRFSIHYISGLAVWLLTSKVDMWILGLFLDSRSLGYYALALRLLEALTSATIFPVLRLAMPLLSPYRLEPAEFNARYRRLVIGATSVWLPVVAGIGVISAAMIPIAFGAKWEDSVPVVQAMCLSAFTLSLTFFTGEVLSAWGRPDLFSKLELLRLVTTVVAFGIAAPLGIIAAGLAWSMVPAIILPVHLYTLHRISGLAPSKLLAEWSKVAVSGTLMVLAILMMQRFGSLGWWLPAAEAALGAAVYVLLLDRVMLPGCVMRLIRLGLGSMPAFATQMKR